MRGIPQWSPSDPRRVEAEGLWGPAVTQAIQIANSALDGADGPELGLALDTGAVNLIGDGTDFEDPDDDQIAWFRGRVAEALTDPRATVLVDQLTSEFLRTEAFGS